MVDSADTFVECTNILSPSPPVRQTQLMQPHEHAGYVRRKTYKAILDLSARHPLLTSFDIAIMTGATESWVKKIMKSDTFMAQRAQMVEDLHGPRLREIQNKMEQTTSLLLDAIARRIADPNAAVSEEVLIKATALLLDRVLPKRPDTLLNPGNPSPPQNVTMVFNGITGEDILRARQKALTHGSTVELELQPQIESAIDVDEDGLPKERRLRNLEGLD